MGQWLVCVHTLAHACVRLCVHMCVRVCVCTCIYACVCLCLCICLRLPQEASVYGEDIQWVLELGGKEAQPKGCPWISGVIDLSIIKSKDEFFQTLGNSLEKSENKHRTCQSDRKN